MQDDDECGIGGKVVGRTGMGIGNGIFDSRRRTLGYYVACGISAGVTYFVASRLGVPWWAVALIFLGCLTPVWVITALTLNRLGWPPEPPKDQSSQDDEPAGGPSGRKRKWDAARRKRQKARR